MLDIMKQFGDGSLNLQGVFTDTNTFVGVARSGETLEADMRGYSFAEKIAHCSE